MSGSKLTCPACEMILVTTTPTVAAAVLTCPRCGICFGVPALETKAAVAEVVAPPAPVARAEPVAAAPVAATQPTPASASVAHPRTDSPHRHAARHRPMAAPAPQPPAGEASWLRDEEIGVSQVKAGLKGADPVSKKGRHKKQDPVILWLMVGSGVLLLIAGVIVAIVLTSDDHKPVKSPAREVSPARSTDSRSAPAAVGSPERKEKPAARPVERKRATAAASAKKEKPGAMKPRDPDASIPGLDAPAHNGEPSGESEPKDK